MKQTLSFLLALLILLAILWQIAAPSETFSTETFVQNVSASTLGFDAFPSFPPLPDLDGESSFWTVVLDTLVFIKDLLLYPIRVILFFLNELYNVLRFASFLLPSSFHLPELNFLEW